MKNIFVAITFILVMNTTAMEQNCTPTKLNLRKQLIDIAVINMLKARGIQIVAEYNIADHLSTGSKTAQELAVLSGLHESSLHRLLSMLASHGIFIEDAQGKFSLTELSKLL